MKACPVFLDSRLRGNDGEEVAVHAEAAWIPACAGMTEAGVAVCAEPAWIPACAGMTEAGVAVRAEPAWIPAFAPARKASACGNNGREGTLLFDGDIFFGDCRIRCPDKI